MNRNDLSAKFQDKFVLEPQKAALAANAIESIYAGIGELAKLGVSYDLVETPAPAPSSVDEYPKMLYHDSKGQITVASRDEENRLGPGWRLTPNAMPAVPVKPAPASAKAPLSPPAQASDSNLAPKEGN